MGLFDDLGVKSKIRKLNSAKDDLVDDSGSINTINSRINDIISDVQSFIRVGSGAITSKLETYKEADQYNDSNIANARSYLQYEINHLQRQLDD